MAARNLNPKSKMLSVELRVEKKWKYGESVEDYVLFPHRVEIK